MTEAPLNVVTLTDSRGLDTYYLNANYPDGYGIDRVFAHRLEAQLRAYGIGHVNSYLIPDHIRDGTVETNISRVAFCRPRWIVLSNGIWETVLNRDMYFEEAHKHGFLKGLSPRGLTDEQRLEVGGTLNRLFFEGRLSVSPEKYRAGLNRLVGYFARRRCSIFWLSLLIPPESHRGGIHHAGDYRPLPFWPDQLRAINDAARSVLDYWGGMYLDLAPLAESLPSLECALIDQWHFTDEFQGLVADLLARTIRDDIQSGDTSRSTWSADNLAPPGRLRFQQSIHTDGVEAWTRPEWPAGRLPMEAALKNCAAGSAVVLTDVDPRDAIARKILADFPHISCVVYPEDCAGL